MNDDFGPAAINDALPYPLSMAADLSVLFEMYTQGDSEQVCASLRGLAGAAARRASPGISRIFPRSATKPDAPARPRPSGHADTPNLRVGLSRNVLDIPSKVLLDLWRVCKPESCILVQRLPMQKELKAALKRDRDIAENLYTSPA